VKSLTTRLVGAIWLASVVVIGSFAYVQVREEGERLALDLGRRAALVGEGLKEAVQPAVARGAMSAVERVVKKFGKGQGVAVYDRYAGLVAAQTDPPLPAATPLPEVTAAIGDASAQSRLRKVEGHRVFVYATPLEHEERVVGALAVFLDASPLARAEREIWFRNAIRLVVLAGVISAVALLIVRMTITVPLTRLALWTRAVSAGHRAPPPPEPDARIFGTLAREVSGLARSLHRARAVAAEEAALRLRGDLVWTEERLRQFAHLKVNGSLFVVSNRQPVSHVWNGRQVQTQVPASGLVTAMEPILRACGGVWVAHGSGAADREVVDARGRIGVPAENPRYMLRRVWLTREEEEGYYYGFANEGLWPLCHIAHTRPLFRPEDWVSYRQVNAKFATALGEEAEAVEAPLVLIQDYHFALLPALVKQSRPEARVALFWHIPWPNSEAFGICPWQEELLQGMLGADVVGFHTQYHCNNFLETVERSLEARVDWEHFSVTRGQHVTYVKPFPISVAPPDPAEAPPVSREALLEKLGVTTEFLGVGVERADYTKGLPERFRALGRFFERYPEYRERLTFVQVAAPSRTRIPRYQELAAEIEGVVEAVNRRFQTRSWRPIVHLDRHHDHHEILPLYRHADFCMVTALHDGMNLVAKEFVAAREDEDGVLVLSRFTGAARELRDAVLVNPYDADGMAEAVRLAVEMPKAERQTRMARMRQIVREHNIYSWAGLLLDELSRIPEDAGPLRTTTTAP
jgi:trehalose 6-phosphate synthase